MKADITIVLDGGVVIDVLSAKPLTYAVADFDIEGMLSKDLSVTGNGELIALQTCHDANRNPMQIFSLASFAEPYVRVALSMKTFDSAEAYDAAVAKLCRNPDFLEEFITRAVKPAMREAWGERQLKELIDLALAAKETGNDA